MKESFMENKDKYSTRNIKSNLTLRIYEDGSLVEESNFSNELTDAFSSFLAGQIASDSNRDIATFELGDDNTTPSSSDTSLGNSLFSKNVNSSNITSTSNVLSVFLNVDNSEANDSPNPIYREVGLFLVNGDMIARALLTPEREKTSSTSINILWEWEFN